MKVGLAPLLAPLVTDSEWDEWLRLFANRNEVAEEYAALMVGNGLGWDGWPAFNGAIHRRWSAAGLSYIKKRAWKLAAERRSEATSTASSPAPGGGPRG